MESKVEQFKNWLIESTCDVILFLIEEAIHLMKFTMKIMAVIFLIEMIYTFIKW